MRRHGGARRILSLELLGFKNLLSPASLYSRVNRWLSVDGSMVCESLFFSSLSCLLVTDVRMSVRNQDAALEREFFWKENEKPKMSLRLLVAGGSCPSSWPWINLIANRLLIYGQIEEWHEAPKKHPGEPLFVNRWSLCHRLTLE